jgi:hypothetical protein
MSQEIGRRMGVLFPMLRDVVGGEERGRIEKRKRVIKRAEQPAG